MNIKKNFFQNKSSKKILSFLIIILFIFSTFIPVLADVNIDDKKQVSFSYEKTSDFNDAFFDMKLSFLMKLARFPSIATCVINDDQVIWSKGYGYYDIDNQKEASDDTIYVIASITKTIVGTALMQLYEQGFFSLDDDVNLFLPFDLRNPNFPDENITFRMLLSHTSSLNTNTRNEYYWINFSGDPPFSFFPMPYLEEFLIPGGKYYHEDVWSDNYKPGEYAMYANVGFDLISYLVEIISGTDFLSYCNDHIFIPLEMYDSSFNLSTLDIDNVAIPYQSHLGIYYQINELPPVYGNNIPPEPYWKLRCFPAGGLYTSINDLSHFLIAHMNEGMYKDIQILEKETVELMQSIQPDNEIKYGLAWMEYPITPKISSMGHGGDLMGVDTWMLYMPDEDIGIIYFANGNPYYGLTPNIGFYSIQLLLYSLFQKGGLSIQNNEISNNYSLINNLNFFHFDNF